MRNIEVRHGSLVKNDKPAGEVVNPYLLSRLGYAIINIHSHRLPQPVILPGIRFRWNKAMNNQTKTWHQPMKLLEFLDWVLVISRDYLVGVRIIIKISDWRCWVTWLWIVRNGADTCTLCLPLDTESEKSILSSILSILSLFCHRYYYWQLLLLLFDNFIWLC